MVIEEVIGELVTVFSPEVADKILGLVVIFKALSLAAILYVIYVVVMGILTYRRIKKVDALEKKANDIDKKVDVIGKNLNKLLKKEKKN